MFYGQFYNGFQAPVQQFSNTQLSQADMYGGGGYGRGQPVYGGQGNSYNSGGSYGSGYGKGAGKSGAGYGKGGGAHGPAGFQTMYGNESSYQPRPYNQGYDNSYGAGKGKGKGKGGKGQPQGRVVPDPRFRGKIFEKEPGIVSFALTDSAMNSKDIDDFALVFEDYITKNGAQTIWELDFSKNALDDDSIVKLFDTLIGFAASVRILKLFRNRIGARGMESIAQFFGLCPMPIAEIHLSHNQINSEAALSLLKGVASNAIYPSEETGPIWCRLENNPIGDYQGVLNKFEEFLEEVRPELKSTDPNAGKVYSLSDRKLHKGDREAKGCIFNLPHFKGGGGPPPRPGAGPPASARDRSRSPRR